MRQSFFFLVMFLSESSVVQSLGRRVLGQRRRRMR